MEAVWWPGTFITFYTHSNWLNPCGVRLAFWPSATVQTPGASFGVNSDGDDHIACQTGTDVRGLPVMW